jgi:hypothetical protein
MLSGFESGKKMQALIAPTEAGYDLNELKRAVLVYDKLFIIDHGDRDLFPSTAFAMAMGMPPIMSMPGGSRVRPMGKTPTYDADFSALLDNCKPLIDAGAIEVTTTWNRAETDSGNFAIGMVPLGGYQLNVQAVLHYYRALARDNAMLTDALDEVAVSLASSPNAEAFCEEGQADGSINADPALPILEGMLQREELRQGLTVIARSRIATALKAWGVAEQRGLVSMLSEPTSLVMDRLGRSARAAIDAAEDDPYWTRRTAILDMVVGEFVPHERLEGISSEDLLRFRTKAMRKASEDRTQLFADVREMAGEATNLDLEGFKDRIRGRMEEYKAKLGELHAERSALGWRMILDVGKAGAVGSAGITAAGGILHIALPVSLSAALFGTAAWGMGKLQENLPTLRKILAAEKSVKGANEFAVFRRLRALEKVR